MKPRILSRAYYLLVFFIGVVLLMRGGIKAEDVDDHSIESSTATPVPPGLVIDNKAFSAGEKFVFKVDYEFVTAGEATLEVLNGPDHFGVPTYQFISRAKSSGFIENFFKVRDYNESIVEKDTLAVLVFHQDLKEGNFKVKRTTTVDYQSGTWVYEREYKGKKTTRPGKMVERACDILSSFFFTRTLDLKTGNEYSIKVFSDDVTYPLRVVVGKKLEKIKVPAGTFECLRVEPFIIGDGIFKTKNGRLIIYMTNDEKKMPVLMQSEIFVGSFDAELVSYRNED